MGVDWAKMLEFITACGTIDLPVWQFKGSDKPQGKGLMIVKHGQGFSIRGGDEQLSMPTSIVALEDRIRDGTITIDDNPVTISCHANAKLDKDGQGNRAFNKKASRGRIDGVITQAMGAGAAGFKISRKNSKPGVIVL